jgi:hypothetical protein
MQSALRFVRWRSITLLVSMLMMPSCLPYAMGATAATARPDELHTRTLVSVIRLSDSAVGGTRIPRTATYDLEFRTGIDERSDVGLRITSLSGVVASYKRRVAGDETRGGLAYQVEGGVVNMADHVMGGVSLVGSGKEYGLFGWFGGLRALAVAPIAAGAARDQATVGGFVGARMEFLAFTAFPEIGVYYDKSALNLRKSSVMVIPSFSIRRSR